MRRRSGGGIWNVIIQLEDNAKLCLTEERKALKKKAKQLKKKEAKDYAYAYCSLDKGVAETRGGEGGGGTAVGWSVVHRRGPYAYCSLDKGVAYPPPLSKQQ